MKLLMNSVCFIAFVLIVAKASAEDEDYIAIRDECLELHNITADELEALQPGESIDETGIDEKFKCFSHCLVDKMGYLDDEGKLNMQRLEDDDHIDDADKAKAIDCKAKHDLIEDPCEYTFQMMKCAMESM